MSDDLVERLGIIARAEMSNYAERTVNESAAALTEARAEIARLREATMVALNAINAAMPLTSEPTSAQAFGLQRAREELSAALAPRDAKQGDA